MRVLYTLAVVIVKIVGAVPIATVVTVYQELFKMSQERCGRIRKWRAECEEIVAEWSKR